MIWVERCEITKVRTHSVDEKDAILCREDKWPWKFDNLSCRGWATFDNLTWRQRSLRIIFTENVPEDQNFPAWVLFDNLGETLVASCDLGFVLGKADAYFEFKDNLERMLHVLQKVSIPVAIS